MTHVCQCVCGPGHLTSHDLLDTDTLVQMAQCSLIFKWSWRMKTIQKSKSKHIREQNSPLKCYQIKYSLGVGH